MKDQVIVHEKYPTLLKAVQHLVNLQRETEERRRLGMDACWKTIPMELWWIIRKEFFKNIRERIKRRHVRIYRMNNIVSSVRWGCFEWGNCSSL